MASLRLAEHGQGFVGYGERAERRWAETPPQSLGVSAVASGAMRSGRRARAGRPPYLDRLPNCARSAAREASFLLPLPPPPGHHLVVEEFEGAARLCVEAACCRPCWLAGRAPWSAARPPPSIDTDRAGPEQPPGHPHSFRHCRRRRRIGRCSRPTHEPRRQSLGTPVACRHPPGAR